MTSLQRRRIRDVNTVGDDSDERDCDDENVNVDEDEEEEQEEEAAIGNDTGVIRLLFVVGR